MLTIEEKRGFRPSPGSIYPALQMLEEGDFLTGQDIDGKRVYTITDKGSELLAKHRETTPERRAAERHRRGFADRARRANDGRRQDGAQRDRPNAQRRNVHAGAGDLERARRDLYALLTHE